MFLVTLNVCNEHGYLIQEEVYCSDVYTQEQFTANQEVQQTLANFVAPWMGRAC